jgi:hypothetical protein
VRRFPDDEAAEYSALTRFRQPNALADPCEVAGSRIFHRELAVALGGGSSDGLAILVNARPRLDQVEAAREAYDELQRTVRIDPRARQLTPEQEAASRRGRVSRMGVVAASGQGVVRGGEVVRTSGFRASGSVGASVAPIRRIGRRLR